MIKETIEIKWAVLFTLTQLLWIAGEKLAGLYTIRIEYYSVYTNFFLLPALVIYLFAILEKRKKYYDGTMDYKEGFLTGLRIMFITTILSPLTITIKFVMLDLFSKLNTYLYEAGRILTGDTANEHPVSWIIILGLTGTPVIGFLLSAIIPVFTTNTNDIDHPAAVSL
jgi:hypothetical protein